MELFGEPQTWATYERSLDDIRILPIGDIQAGAPGCDLPLLKKYVDWGVSNNCWYIGLGDYCDSLSPSNKKTIEGVIPSLYDSARIMLDEAAQLQLDRLCKVLLPTKGRWLGILKGHHSYTFADGTTTESRLCNLLDARHAGYCTAILLPFRSGHLAENLVIWAHHGHGSGQTVAAPLNKLEKMTSSFFADIYMMGHYSRYATTTKPWINYEWRRKRHSISWKSVDRHLVVTGSYMKGYEEGSKDAMGLPTGSYVERGMMSPLTLGSPLVTIRPRIVEGEIKLHIFTSCGDYWA